MQGAHDKSGACASQPLLTLAIPTYNRSCLLAELLETVIPQMAEEHRVELLISDNCSTDDTRAMLESFRCRGLNFRYQRSDENLGADGNFYQCFTEAKGKYFWLLGDDDVLVNDAIRKILSLLEQGEIAGKSRLDFDIVYLSSFSFIGKYQAGKNSLISFVPHFAELITDGSFFLRRVNGLIALISTVIVNKNRLIVENHLPIERLERSSLSQLGWVLPLVKRQMRVLYVWERMVGYRSYNSVGWGPCEVFGVNMQRIVAKYFAREPKLEKSLINALLCIWMPATLMGLRRGRHAGLLTEDCSRILRPVFRRNWRYWIYVETVFRPPLWIAEVVYRGLSAVNKATRTIAVVMRHAVGRQQYFSP